MPTVPVYGQPRVSAAPLPGQQVPTSAPLEAFGGGLSQPLQQARGLAGDVMQMELKERQDDLEMQAAEYQAKLSQEETRLKTVLGGMRGKDALSGHEQVLKEFDTFHQSLEKDIKDTDLRDAVRRQYLRQKDSLNSWAAPYAMAQKREYDDASTKATIQAEQEALGVDWHPKRVAISIETQRVALRKFAERNGMPENELALEEARIESQSHARVINAMLNAGQDLDAKRYYDQNKKNLLDRENDAIARTLEEGSLRGESQRQADQIMAKRPSLAQAMEEARKIEDPKLRDLVEGRVKTRISEEKAALAEAQDSLYEEVARRMDQAGGANPRDIASPQEWTNLTAAQRDALARRTADPENDDRAWMEFMFLPQQELARMNMAQFETRYWGRLDKAHRTKAESRLKEARDAATSPEKMEKYQGGIGDQEMLLRAMKFYNKGTITEKDNVKSILDNDQKRKAWREEWDRFEAARQAYHATTGKNADDKAKQKIIADLFREEIRVQVPGADDEERRFRRLKPDELQKFQVPVENIPPDDLGWIRGQLQKVGKVYSPDKASRLYRAYLLRDKTLFDQILGE